MVLAQFRGYSQALQQSGNGLDVFQQRDLIDHVLPARGQDGCGDDRQDGVFGTVHLHPAFQSPATTNNNFFQMTSLRVV